MKENSYVFALGILFRRNYDGVILGYLSIEKVHEILKEMDEGVCGGHFAPKVTAHHIIGAGYYWNIIFKDSYSFIRECSTCQKNSR